MSQIGGFCLVVVELAQEESVTNGAMSSSIIVQLLVTQIGRVLNVEIYHWHKENGGDQSGKGLKVYSEILSPLQFFLLLPDVSYKCESLHFSHPSLVLFCYDSVGIASLFIW